MSAKHTPGPWVASFESVDPEWAVITTVGGSVIANVNADSRQQANAHLIAAAPDMLAALKLYDAYGALPTDRGGPEGAKHKAYAAFVAAKDAAISKAEGRS